MKLQMFYEKGPPRGWVAICGITIWLILFKTCIHTCVLSWNQHGQTGMPTACQENRYRKSLPDQAPDTLLGVQALFAGSALSDNSTERGQFSLVACANCRTDGCLKFIDTFSFFLHSPSTGRWLPGVTFCS